MPAIPRNLLQHITSDHYFLNPVSATFQGRDIFAPVVGWLSKWVEVDKFGEPISDFTKFTSPKPKRVGDNLIKGVVLKIDKFGNILTNLRPEDLPQLFAENPPPFKIIINQQEITRLNLAYSMGKPSELFAIVGSSGYIEICTNRGSAAKVLNVNRGVEVGVMLGRPRNQDRRKSGIRIDALDLLTSRLRGSRLRGFLRQRLNANLGHPAAFHFQNGVAAEFKDETLPALRNESQPRQHKSRQRFVPRPARQNDIALTGQIAKLRGPTGMPARLLLQRLDSAAPGERVRGHVDFGCTDEQALSLHVGLGARVAGAHPYWTVLADPAGREYCLVTREPDDGR